MNDCTKRRNSRKCPDTIVYIFHANAITAVPGACGMALRMHVLLEETRFDNSRRQILPRRLRNDGIPADTPIETFVFNDHGPTNEHWVKTITARFHLAAKDHGNVPCHWLGQYHSRAMSCDICITWYFLVRPCGPQVPSSSCQSRWPRGGRCSLWSASWVYACFIIII